MVRMSLAVLTLAAGFGMSAAHAESADRVSFGQRVVVGEQDEAQDIVCFFCSVQNHGRIRGDVVSFFGGVKSDGTISGDVVSFLGDVSLGNESTLNGDVVILGGALHRNGNAQIGKDQVVFPPIIFAIPFIVIGLILWGISSLFRRRTPAYFML